MIYGYARVSTDGQNLDAQQAELRAAGCDKVFSETASGNQTNRPQLKWLLHGLAAGDQVVVVRIDRLARSTRDLHNILGIVAEKFATFRSLREPWANLDTPSGQLLLSVLGAIGEFERDLILTRTTEGREAARARGTQFGRPKALTLNQCQFVANARRAGQTCRALATVLNCSVSTISRIPPAADDAKLTPLEAAILKTV